MELIINTEEVYSEYGDLIRFIYHYEDGTTRERSTFISFKELENINSLLANHRGFKTS